MADKMLIDASHEEETRVVVVRGSRIEEFDFESQHKKQLRGNIYLAKVTRVEPSLQAAFVDYGGNRHGFLAFSEIHPDYYQIPLADRQALLAAEAEAEAERARSENDEDEAAEARRGRGDDNGGSSADPDRDDDDEGDDAAPPAAKVKSRRTRGSRKSGKKSEEAGANARTDAQAEERMDERAEEATAGTNASEAPIEPELEEAITDLEGGPAAGNVVSDPSSDKAPADEDDNSRDDDDGPKTMAAAIDTDSISEPVDVPLDADEDERDPGEVDLEAAQHVEGKIDKPLPASESDSDGSNGDSGNGSDDDDEEEGGDRRPRSRKRRGGGEDSEEDNGGRVESVGAEDALEELPDRSSVRKPRKQYRIQEVIKRRQILLVQVVKEERGNKGAALTTYLSLAGRYSVLMPNTARGGGISRKITNVQDRKRLKEIARGLEVPQGMGVILRTAGANRTKAEIKRDFEYLMRLWETVRNLTLASTAPCLVYEEGSLIKRSIRDLYNKDIGEVVVSGEEGYREAKDFMKMLMPSHAKVVQPYREVHPIFSRSGIEAQLDRMLQPQVTLKSGGYIIINQTEALVAIDVNSGRSTKEHSIEDTALQTNLEAADEVARQLRLRDLAGLIVVDFIDMEEKRNNRSVEKRLKDALKNDRARIQVGRISHFGLLEMSRQRIRASVLESTTQVCDHCGGTGHVRSQSSVALHVIRSIEEFLLKSTTHDITVRTMPETALYVLNQKRETIVEMERRFGVSIVIEADNTVGSTHLAIDRGAPVEVPVKIEDIIQAETAYAEDADDDAVASWDEESDDEDVVEVRDEQPRQSADNGDSDGDQSKRKRRRRRRGGRDRGEGDGLRSETNGDERDHVDDDEEAGDDESVAARGDDNDGDRPKKRRRRGKRGGRRNRGLEDGAQADAVAGEGDGTGDGERAGADAERDEAAMTATAGNDVALDAGAPEAAADDEAARPAALEEPAVEAAEPDQAAAETEAAPAPAEETAAAPEEKPKRRRAPRRKKGDDVEAEAAAAASSDAVSEAPPAEREAPAPAASAIDVATAEDTPVTAEPVELAEPPAPREPVVVSNGTRPSDTDEAEQAAKPKKVGWWQKRGFF